MKIKRFFLFAVMLILSTSLSAERIYTSQHVYETGKILGKGKRGRVLTATDELGRVFAAKVMFTREEQMRLGCTTGVLNHMFDSEGTSKTATRAFEIGLEMDHPSIIKCYEMTIQEGRTWTILEYVEGTPLDKIRSQRFSRNQAFSLANDFLEALTYAASNYIVHRDLCMQNLMMDVNGRLKLIDLDSFHSLLDPRWSKKPKKHYEYVDKINLVFLEILRRGMLLEEEFEDFFQKVWRLPKHTKFQGKLGTPMTAESAHYFVAYFNSLKYILNIGNEGVAMPDNSFRKGFW